MKWQFWLRNRPLPPAPGADHCAHVRPLLSLMSDGMASAKEVREAQAHLQTCDDCRQALTWIEATRQVIAARAVVLPPPDMRARIARAIAASAETAVPVVPIALPPARRTFALRPAYAAAASVVVAGAFLGHYLLAGGHAPGTVLPVSPTHTASSGQGQTGTGADSKMGKPGTVPTRIPRKQPLVVATLPHDTSEQANPAQDALPRQPHSGDLSRARQANPSRLAVPGLSANLTPRPASPASGIKPNAAQVASGLHGGAAIVPRAAPRHSALLASRPSAQSPAGIHTHMGSDRAQVATLPPAHANTPAASGSALITTPPPAASVPVPPSAVARLPDAPFAPARAVPGDALGSVRTSLASYRSEGYARRLFMANGAHVRQSSVLVPLVYTPTALPQSPASHRTTLAALRPAQVQPSPQAASLAPDSTQAASNQRRSERGKQVLEASVTSGA